MNKHKAYRKKYEKLGRCIICGNLNDKVTKWCGDCRRRESNRHKERYYKIKALGICCYCHKQKAIIGKTKCEDCFFRSVAYHNLGSKLRYKEIKDLFYLQDKTCPVSGRALLPGINASLDHIIPISKHGTDDISNLRWVDYYVNQAKNNLHENEFKQLVIDIYKNLIEDK